MPGRVRHPTAISEREFHAWLAGHLPAGHEGLLPIGDDAAALRVPKHRVAVLTTDALVEGTHFLPRSPPGRVGAAAAAVNLSDLAAKGAEPAAVLLSLVVPPGTPRAWAAAVVRGAEAMSERHGARVVGGDTKPGPVRTVVGFALGWGRTNALAPRSGARAGDLLVVTGTVGRGGCAAARLRASRRAVRPAFAALLDVRPRVAEGIALVRAAHAMLDTSDGLAEACRLLSASSQKRVVIDEERLPWERELARTARTPARRRSVGFYGGDYELLAAVPPNRTPEIARAVERAGGRLTVVGRVERGRGAWLAAGGREMPMPLPGWRPFALRPRLPIF
jgi:thiamine-monophosphate kinase